MLTTPAQDAPRGFVSFVDERKKMRYASKRDPPRERLQQQPPAKKAKFKGEPDIALGFSVMHEGDGG